MADSTGLAHAKLSASGAERWMACPASVRAEEGLPDSSSMFAFEGTCAHKLAEDALNAETHPEEFLGETIQLEEHEWSEDFGKEFEVTEEMVEHVGAYYDYCRALPGEQFIEVRLDYSRWVKDGFGTGDHLSLDTITGMLYVTDLKYGMGVAKYAEDNPQAMIYALAAYDNYSWMCEIKGVIMCIYQPRKDHIDVHEISVTDLLKFATELEAAALVTEQDDAPFNPGETQCKFCKVKSGPFGCEAFDKHVMDNALDGFDFVGDQTIAEAKPVDSFNTSKLQKVLLNKKLLTDWIAALEKRTMALIIAGDAPAGLKAVAGKKGNTKWTLGEEAILRKLKQQKGVAAASVQVIKPITPTQAKKVLGEKHVMLRKYSSQADGKPTIVSIEDKRDAIDFEAEAIAGFESS